ncbi:response regulator transcription factor [Nguyenibacter vanlangensis]|nr:response regulator transcription factor [Nguyenibacter vanlangensis]
MLKLLIVDDDEEILSLLDHFFRSYGHHTRVARDGRAMFEILDAEDIDLVILDLMLPGEGGLDLCRRLRTASGIPVIMLTAAVTTTDRVVGLELGADDYITKPFDPRELLARVRAVLRRGEIRAEPARDAVRPSLYFDGWKLDIARRELRSSRNTLVPLSGREFDLLLAFAERPQQVLGREHLLDFAHGVAYDVYDRSIDTQISRLRRKLEPDPKNPTIIRTIRSGGYMFTPSVRRG